MNGAPPTDKRPIQNRAASSWRVDSEYGPLRDALLCPPDYFDWIPRSPTEMASFERAGGFDAERAKKQHQELVENLHAAGVTCHFLAPDPELPYQVFTRDSSSMTPWGAVVAQIALPSRRGEYAAVIDFYVKSGIPIWRMPTAGCIEGADVMVVRPGLILVGYSDARTQEAAARQMARWIEAEGWEAHLVPFDEHFIHLDALICMASDRLATACVEAVPEVALELLEKRGVGILPVSYHDTMKLGCNILALGADRVLSTHDNQPVNSVLRERHIQVYELDYSMFTTHFGGIHCSVMPLRRDPES